MGGVGMGGVSMEGSSGGPWLARDRILFYRPQCHYKVPWKQPGDSAREGWGDLYIPPLPAFPATNAPTAMKRIPTVAIESPDISPRFRSLLESDLGCC